MLTRRLMLTTGLAALALRPDRALSAARQQNFPVMRSDAEWKRLLAPDQYAVLRKEETERAGSSPLNAEQRPGVYRCVGCDQPLYASSTKFESGTGWPSFFESLAGAVGTREDRQLVFLKRTEVHCSRCGGHLGHVFDDGPPPTGLRHCINGVALKFAAAEG